MAQKNAITNKSSQLTIDPGASGDSFIQLDINTTGEFRFGVDDTDDSFRVSAGSALGTTDTLVITAAGEVTKPLQPAFLATQTSAGTNVTGDGTLYTIACATEIYDQNVDYSSPTFTAPVTGRYLFTGFVFNSGSTTSTTSTLIQLIGSNRSPIISLLNGEAQSNPSDATGRPVAAYLDMDALDTATLGLTISNGTKVIDVDGNGLTFFNAQLIA